MKRTLFYLLIVIVATFILSCDWNQPSEIKIGILFPMTGDEGDYGKKGSNAIELAIEQINSSGGIGGKKVKAIFEDSKSDAATGVTAIQKLISVDKVSAVVGDIVSAVTIPAATVAEKNKVIMIAPTSSAPPITNAGVYIYRVWSSDLAEGAAAGSFAKNKGYKKAAILHVNNDYGTQIAEIFAKNFETSEQKIVAKEAYDPKATDYKATLTKLKSLSPDVVYVAGYFEDTGTMLKQSKEIGISTQFIGATAIEDKKFIEIAGSSAEGIIYPLATGFDAKSQDPATKNFVEAFVKKFNYEPTWVESHCYDAFMLVVEAMKSNPNEITGDNMRKFLDVVSYEGVTGKIKFDENGDVTKPIVFKTVKNGEFIKLK
jgi:branched-chain amino acid transport system substrate-binding protein